MYYIAFMWNLFLKENIFQDEGSATTNDYDTQSLPERQYVRKSSKYSTHEPERVSRLRTEEVYACTKIVISIGFRLPFMSVVIIFLAVQYFYQGRKWSFSPGLQIIVLSTVD